MKEEFILFLKRKRILTKFKKNAINGIGTILNRDSHAYIHGSFDWDCTPEGFDFWSRIDLDWREYLETGKTNKNV